MVFCSIEFFADRFDRLKAGRLSLRKDFIAILLASRHVY
jgi:hypothetical protein